MLNELSLKKRHDFCASGKPALTVVMIHGIASDAGSFNTMLEYLEGMASMKDVRFVTFDLLGWGESEVSDELKYDYKEQVEALHNSIEELKIETPLVLVGHSMGTSIVTRYADTYKRSIRELILIAPPVYTEEDLVSPLLQGAVQIFRDKIGDSNQQVAESRSFDLSMKNIVLNKRNYKTLAEIKTPTILVWGEKDVIIASFNIPKLLEENPKYLTAIQTPSGHSISKDKYTKIAPILERILNA